MVVPGQQASVVVHLAQAVAVRGYVPALITSLISLPPSAYIIYKSWLGMETGASAITGAAVGIASANIARWLLPAECKLLGISPRAELSLVPLGTGLKLALTF